MIPLCVVSGCRRVQTHRQDFLRGHVVLTVQVCSKHAAGPVPFPNDDLTNPVYSERLPFRYTDVAANEAVDIRIIDGPASQLIPAGRGRSTTRGMRP